ncbi:MAG: alpha/beta hydrolase [Bacteroidaceae bacterium]|jgi:pimeloyl-ACP methyl ester carboxylesterase
MIRNLLMALACLAGAFSAGQAAWAADPVTEELWIENGNRRIYGVQASPAESEGRLPVVVIAHGFNGSHEFGCNYFDTLCALGYRCYAFDFPCGALHSRSDANTMNMSVRDEVSDLEAIVRHFRAQADVDSTSIVVVGESQGGLVAALAAAEQPQLMSRLVLVYPALCIPDNWNSRYARESDIPDTTRVWNVPLGRRFFRELRGMEVYPKIGRYAGPVLIVHGDKDPVVPLDYSVRAAETYPDAVLHVVRGAGHGFGGAAWEEALGQVAAFLRRAE